MPVYTDRRVGSDETRVSNDIDNEVSPLGYCVHIHISQRLSHFLLVSRTDYTNL